MLKPIFPKCLQVLGCITFMLRLLNSLCYFMLLSKGMLKTVIMELPEVIAPHQSKSLLYNKFDLNIVSNKI